ncbi:DNA cytosine methyltransferase [Acinetobacter bouvetii]|uniref:DNA cytosine methyltransferase n=1 Tax=Acinetobacter bouvetii TaxID=202951 RepID=A0A4Q7AUR9_9GAMM|nr:DNA cytosine methyltransferase [Acinetobacter bouvetii]RZG64154.1 DNA cytosine methyltransferase [Acinetobacter bouvetii]
MNELALFAGAGGGILASHLMGWNTVCAVERDAYAAQILAQRQNDGILPPFPIWSDVCSFDGKPWRGIIHVISGGFPCQDISAAGKGAGIDGARSGMWAEMARIIGEVRPQFVFVENSPMLVGRGLARVISDLAQMGYDAQWARFSASNFGAPHERDRLWIVAHTMQSGAWRESQTGLAFDSIESCEWLGEGESWSRPNGMPNMANTSSFRLEEKRISRRFSEKVTNLRCDGTEISNTQGVRWKQTRESERSSPKRIGWCGQERTRWWSVEPRLGRVADGVAHRVDRLKAIGNGQVPIVAKSAFEYLRNDK